jgi:hypothetical protein
MQENLRQRSLPDPDRLSVLAAVILLAYAISRFIDLTVQDIAFQLPGFFFSIQINLRTLVALLVGLLAALGVDWLVRDHPKLGKKKTYEHWLLPALTALVIGFPLGQIPPGLTWWAGFAIGGTILILVLVAEYITVDHDDLRQPLAAVGLSIVSFALFLTLAVALRFSGVRLFLILPALTLAGGLVCLRFLHLRLSGRWLWLPAGILMIILGQFVTALHYWPLTPIAYGLALLGPTYALSSLFASLEEGNPFPRALVEPLIILGLIWLTAALVG